MQVQQRTGLTKKMNKGDSDIIIDQLVEGTEEDDQEVQQVVIRHRDEVKLAKLKIDEIAKKRRKQQENQFEDDDLSVRDEENSATGKSQQFGSDFKSTQKLESNESFYSSLKATPDELMEQFR